MVCDCERGRYFAQTNSKTALMTFEILKYQTVNTAEKIIKAFTFLLQSNSQQ